MTDGAPFPGSELPGADVLALFDRWLDLPEADRQTELERIGRADPAAHDRLLALIRADVDAQARDFLGHSAVDHALRTLATQPMEESPLPQQRRVGPWALLRSLGAGGMGRVWLARRDDGLYEGQVAIKMLRETVADDLAAERFQREGQILARLAHPHIARLLDAGTLPDGQRYLVLEYVRGERIDRYCDARHLDIAARIRLFDQVCGAVAHAHANLVVHRDLKPANILVEDGGSVKLLDFGVAKLIEGPLDQAEDSPLTRLAGAGLTPEYAAPEQIEGSAITTATDVYSLGMVLYRLLSGGRPYGSEISSPAQWARHIAETEPLRLSANFSDGSGETQRQAAHKRGATPERLRRQLRGDLDNIIAKALRKSPAQRYASVAALAADLQAYLADRPVAARPDALAYRLGKFVHRNRLAVAATATVGLVLLGAALTTLWQARIAIEERTKAQYQASRARQQALVAQSESARAQTETQRAQAEARRAAAEEARAKEQQAQAERYRAQARQEAVKAREQEAAARQQAQVAKAEAAKARAVRDFMVDIFRANLPATGDIEQAQQMTARELLEAGSQRIRAKFAAQPELQADLLDIVGELFYRLGDQAKARELTARRVEVLERMPDRLAPANVSERLAAHQNLGLLSLEAGDPAAVRRAAQQSSKIAQEVGAASALERVRSLALQARAEKYRDPRRSLAMATEVLATLDQWDHISRYAPARANIHGLVAGTQALLGRFDLALEAARSALAVVRPLSAADRWDVALHTANRGRVERAADRMKDAQASLKQALAAARRTLGQSHPDSLHIQADLGAVLHAGTAPAEGLRLLEEAVRRSGASSRRNAIDDLLMRLNLTDAYYADGRMGDAMRLSDGLIAQLQPDPELRVLLAFALADRARLLAARGDGNGAVAAASEAGAIASELGGAGSSLVADALLAQGEAQLAMDPATDLWATMQKLRQLGDGSGRRFPSQTLARDLSYSEFRLLAGETSGAKAIFASIVNRIEDDDERDYHRRLQARALVGQGRAATMRGEWEEARRALERAIDLYERLGSTDSVWLADARVALADCLIYQDQRGRAAALIASAQAAYAKQLPLARRFLYPLEKVRQRLR